MHLLAALVIALLIALPASAQVAPDEADLRAYDDLHAAAARDVGDIERRIAAGENKEAVDTRSARRCMSPPLASSTRPPARWSQAAADVDIPDGINRHR